MSTGIVWSLVNLSAVGGGLYCEYLASVQCMCVWGAFPQPPIMRGGGGKGGVLNLEEKRQTAIIKLTWPSHMTQGKLDMRRHETDQ